MANWTERDLARQFERANGWIKFFKTAAERYQLPPEILLAIASRETNMRNIIGDGGHGYGIMQIDDEAFPSGPTGLWKDVNAAIRRVPSSFTANNRPSGMGKIIGSKWVARRSLARDNSAKTGSCALLSPPYNSALWAYSDLTNYGMLIAGLQEGTTPETSKARTGF